MKVHSRPKTRRERRTENRNKAFEVGVIKSPLTGIAVSQLLDTSRSGLRVTAPCPMPLDARVQVVFDGTTMSGSVRNCVRARAAQFHVGIGDLSAIGAEVPERLYADLDRLTSVLPTPPVQETSTPAPENPQPQVKQIRF